MPQNGKRNDQPTTEHSCFSKGGNVVDIIWDIFSEDFWGTWFVLEELPLRYSVGFFGTFFSNLRESQANRLAIMDIFLDFILL